MASRRKRLMPLYLASAALVLVAGGCRFRPDYELLADDDGEVDARLEELGVSFASASAVRLDLENSPALWHKLDALRGATRSIAIGAVTLADDYAGAAIAQLLVQKATAPSPVKVRLIVDGKTAFSRRSFFQMLVAKGNGNIEVHYFRPIPERVLADLGRLGIAVPAFINAVLEMNTDALSEQIRQSSAAAANPKLGEELLKLGQKLTLRPSSEAMAMVENAPASDDNAAVDALVSAHLGRSLESIGAAADGLQLTASPAEWFDLTKTMRHSLMLVDGQEVLAGSRTLTDTAFWERDHPLRAGQASRTFMHVDVQVSGPQVATAAEATFDGYLDPDCYTAGLAPASCETQIPMTRETAAVAADAETAYQALVQKARRLEEARNYTRSYDPIQKSVLTAPRARVAYAENRMFPAPAPALAADAAKPAAPQLLREESSRYNAALAALVDHAKAGESVVIQNGHVYFPPLVQMAVYRALRRGVDVTVLSNAPETSDWRFVAQAARLQYRNLLRVGALGPGRFEVFEYLTEETLHAKVAVISDRYLLVGAVDADPRSEHLDTNNGVIIDSTELAGKYKRWLADLSSQLLQRTRSVAQEGGGSRITAQMQTLTLQRLEADDELPTSDRMVQYHRSLNSIADASFLDSEAGARSRAALQALFLRY